MKVLRFSALTTSTLVVMGEKGWRGEGDRREEVVRED